jgi:hypothetical protein
MEKDMVQEVNAKVNLTGRRGSLDASSRDSSRAARLSNNHATSHTRAESNTGNVVVLCTSKYHCQYNSFLKFQHQCGCPGATNRHVFAPSVASFFRRSPLENVAALPFDQTVECIDLLGQTPLCRPHRFIENGFATPRADDTASLHAGSDYSESLPARSVIALRISCDPAHNTKREVIPGSLPLKPREGGTQ